MQAIVIKKMPIREHDELVVCYTREYGKQRYRAKSISLPTSKQANHLDVFNYIDYDTVIGNGHMFSVPIITSTTSIKTFRHMKSSLPALASAYFVLECFDKLVFDNEQDARLWDFLLERVNYIDAHAYDSAHDWRTTNRNTERSLMDVLGYSPEMSVADLYPKPFVSLQFLKNVLQ